MRARTEAPLPARDAYTWPSLTPITCVVQSPVLNGTCTTQHSAPVARSMHTTGEPLGSPDGGKPVCRTMNTLLPAITGCHAMIDGRPVLHAVCAVSGPYARLRPLRAALPPELGQSCAAPGAAAKATDHHTSE